MSIPIHDLAVKFCQENNFQPVALIEKAMNTAVIEATTGFLETVRKLREDLQQQRERSNKDNKNP